jgi:CRISPR-associated endonuclease/helicase Cas3
LTECNSNGKILAKSDGTTLNQHIEDCLVIWRELKSSLPALPVITKLPDFWKILFVSVYFHDLGKIHSEFQKVLKSQENLWENQRHELYSIPYIDKMNLPAECSLLVKRVILGHHKDFKTLFDRYKSQATIDFEFHNVWTGKLSYHPEDFIENLRHCMTSEYLTDFFSDFLTKSKQNGNIEIELPNKIVYQKLSHPYLEIARECMEFDIQMSEYWQNLLIWGALKICDHYASGGVRKINQLNDTHFQFLDNLRENLTQKGSDLFLHQKTCFNYDGNCILIAPTGTGKTESAIGWLRKQINTLNGRAFYVLPYTASINAMHKRLTEMMEKEGMEYRTEIVGVQHGKLSQYLASFLEDVSNKYSTKRNDQIKALIEQYRRMIQPLEIITPFQIMKYFYGVKGFEMGLVELSGAKIIFDEIHAYDTVTFAQIIVMLKVMTEFLKCSVLVMTATLPTFMIREIAEVLKVETIVKADAGLLSQLNRHRITIVEGAIQDQLEKINNYLESNQRVMVVCNTVTQSQLMYSFVFEKFKLRKDQITLLHGRFNRSDRMKKEKGALDSNTKVLIGTQAIEVSLDIDYDVLFTEPAPLDALLQRFGRVNRKATKPPCPVSICTEGGKDDFRIYPTPIVKRTLENLKIIDCLKEADIQNLLDNVYPGREPEQENEFQFIKTAFEQSLKSLQPFSSHKEKEEELYEKFDGIEVLPAQFFPDYKRLIENYDFIKAENFCVSIHKGMYMKFKNENPSRIVHMRIPIRKNDEVFDHFVTIIQNRYSNDIGLMDEFKELEIDQFF